MDVVVLDTSVASFAVRHDSRLGLYRPHYQGRRVVLPFQVVAELRFGAMLDNWGADRRRQLERYISRCIVWPYHDDLTSAWAALMVHARRSGLAPDATDAWIAATALQLGAPLLTHDADFRRLSYPDLTVACHAS